MANSILITKINEDGSFKIEKMDNKAKLYTQQSNIIVFNKKILFINNILKKDESVNFIFSLDGRSLEKHNYLFGKNIKKSTNMTLKSALLDFKTPESNFIV